MSYAGLAVWLMAKTRISLRARLLRAFAFAVISGLGSFPAVAGTFSPGSVTLLAVENFQTGEFTDGTATLKFVTDLNAFLSFVEICNPNCDDPLAISDGNEPFGVELRAAPWVASVNCIQFAAVAQSECTVDVIFPFGSENSTAELVFETFSSFDFEGSTRTSAFLTGVNQRTEMINPLPGSVSFVTNSAAGPEGSTLQVAVERFESTEPFPGPHTFTIEVLEAGCCEADTFAATEGVDFRFANGNQLTWLSGESGTKSLAIDLLNDSLLEGSEFFDFAINNSTSTDVVGQFPFMSVEIEDTTQTPSVVSFTSGSATVSEADGSISLALSRSPGPAIPVSVDFLVVDGTAVSPADYALLSPTNGVVSWAANDFTDKQIVLSIVQDELDNELTENLSVGILGYNGAVAGQFESVAVSITNNVPPRAVGTFNFVNATQSVTEGDAALPLSVTRTQGSDGLVELQVTAVAGTAVEGVDFTLSDSVLRWTSGDVQAKSISLTAIDDRLSPEAAELVELELTPFLGAATEEDNRSSEASFGANQRTRITINDRAVDMGTFAFNTGALSVPRDDEVARVSVRRIGGSEGAVELRVISSDGTATAGTDYTAVNQVVSWEDGDASARLVAVNLLAEGASTTPGQSSRTFTLSLVDDAEVATDRATIGDPDQVSITITDDIAVNPGNFGFQMTELLVEETQLQAVLNVTRTGGSDGSVSLRVMSSAGTATAGSDYTPVDEVLTWADGETQPMQVTVDIATNEGSPEPDETIILDLSRATGTAGEGDTTALANIVAARAQATVTIQDSPDLPRGTLRFVADNIVVSEDEGEATLSVERISGSDGPVSVDIVLVEGSARTPEDFGPASTASLSWNPGETGVRTFTVPIVLDGELETDETFTARLVGASPASVLEETGTAARITIRDSTVVNTGQIQWTLATQNVREDAATVELSAERVQGSELAVSVSYRTENGSAEAGIDYNSATGVLSWSEGEVGIQTVTVPILFDDVNPEPLENFFVVLENAEPLGDDVQLGERRRVEVNIENIAPPTPNPGNQSSGRLVLSQTALQVNEADGTVSIQVDRLDSANGAISVQFQTVGDTAQSGLDFVQADGVLDWADGDSGSRIITVAVSIDSIAEPTPEQFFVNLFNETAEQGFTVTLEDAQATVTIVDNFNPGSIVFSQSAYNVVAGQTSVSIILQRVGGSDGELSVEFATEARALGPLAPALPNQDFAPFTQRVSWLDGEVAPQTVVVSINPPVAAEPPEEFTVVLRDQTPASTTPTGITQARVVILADGTVADDSFDISIVSGDNQSGFPGDQLQELVIALQPRDESADINNVTVQWRSVPETAVQFVNGSSTSPDANSQARTLIRLLEPGFISVVASISSGSAEEAFNRKPASTNRIDGTRVEAGPGEVVFIVRSGFGAGDGLNANQSSTGFALDSACAALEDIDAGEGNLSAAQQDLLATCNALDTAGQNGLLAAQLDRLAPEELFFIADSVVDATDLQVTNVFNRINSIRSGRVQESVDLSGLNLNIDGQFIPGAVVNAAQNALSGGAASDDSLVTPFGFFANGSVSVGELGGGDNQRDADVQTSGLTVGVDYRIASNVVVGAGLGISNNDTDFTGGEGEANLQAVNLTAFATYFETDQGYADLVLDVGQNSFEVTRRINLPSAAAQFARGETDALVGSLNVSVGRDFQRGTLQFGPYARLGYTWASVDAYREVATTAAAGFGSTLNIQSHSVRSLSMSFGGQVSSVINTRKAVLLPQARLEFELENEANKDDITASFASDPESTAFTIQGNERDTSHLNIGLGSSIVFKNGRSAFAFYETQLQQDFIRQHWLKFGVRLEF